MPSEVVEVRNTNTSTTTSSLPKNARSQTLTEISTVPLEVRSTSGSGLLRAEPPKPDAEPLNRSATA